MSYGTVLVLLYSLHGDHSNDRFYYQLYLQLAASYQMQNISSLSADRINPLLILPQVFLMWLRKQLEMKKARKYPEYN